MNILENAYIFDNGDVFFYHIIVEIVIKNIIVALELSQKKLARVRGKQRVFLLTGIPSLTPRLDSFSEASFENEEKQMSPRSVGPVFGICANFTQSALFTPEIDGCV